MLIGGRYAFYNGAFPPSSQARFARLNSFENLTKLYTAAVAALRALKNRSLDIKLGNWSGIPRVMSGDSSHLRRYWIPALKEAIFGQLQPRHGPSPHEPGGPNIETLVVLVSGWHRPGNKRVAHSVLELHFIR